MKLKHKASNTVHEMSFAQYEYCKNSDSWEECIEEYNLNNDLIKDSEMKTTINKQTNNKTKNKSDTLL